MMLKKALPLTCQSCTMQMLQRSFILQIISTIFKYMIQVTWDIFSNKASLIAVCGSLIRNWNHQNSSMKNLTPYELLESVKFHHEKLSSYQKLKTVKLEHKTLPYQLLDSIKFQHEIPSSYQLLESVKF